MAHSVRGEVEIGGGSVVEQIGNTPLLRLRDERIPPKLRYMRSWSISIRGDR